MEVNTVVWKRLDLPGHEACRVHDCQTGWKVNGVAVLAYEVQACRLDYLIDCDPHWVTRSALVTGWVGGQAIHIAILRDEAARWQLNGRSIGDVEGCSDIDLNFSPSTNLLPIRRLKLAVGATASVRAAWLRFPGFALEALDQSYTRLASHCYRYESGGGRFVAEVTVDEAGLVIDYGRIWSREGIAGHAQLTT